MTRRVTGSRLEPYLVGDFMLFVDQLDTTFGHHRPHRIINRGLQEIIFRARKEIPLGSTDQILRVRKSRYPFAVLPHRIPADVIQMKMSTNNVVYRLTRIAELLQILEKR